MSRIGVNALYLIPGDVGGTEIYLRNLLQALAAIDTDNEYVIFTNRETASDVLPKQPNFTWEPQPIRASFRPARILWEQTGLPLAARRNKIDVLFNPGFTCPILCPCPNVTVFHDLQHKRHPEYFRWFDLPFWRVLLWASARISKRLISVSAATRDDLRHFYGVDSTVIHHGVEPEFFEIARKRESRDFLLCVSTLHPHKNLERLLRAHTKGLPELVITGLRGFAAQHLEQLAGPGVRFTGWIPRKDLYELFRTARGFIYPSMFEGFGMPVLEAMAAGVPVACSDIPPLREIADGCVRFFNPEDESEIHKAMLQLLEPADTQAAQNRAHQFTWEKTARATLDVCDKLKRVATDK
jgi:glycosyltransferase involved in cell wall biosynthesis